MKIILKQTLLSSVMLLMIGSFFSIGPNFSSAQENPGQSGYKLLVDCTGGSRGSATKECTFKDAIAQVNKIIDFLFYISVLLATIAFIYCGFLFLTAGGDTGKVGDAKSIFFKVVIGFIWIFAAWLIVNFITGAFGLKPDISILEKGS